MTDLDLVRQIEEMSLNALPCLATVQQAGWVARFAAGVTGRANSINALRPEPGSLVPLLEAVEPLYRRRGLAPRARLTPLCPLDTEAVLLARGYAPADRTITKVAAIAPALAVDPAVTFEPAADDAWRAAYGVAAGRFGAAELAILARMHAAIAPAAAFARLVEDGAVLALGYAVAERGFVSMQEIATMPAARGRGAGRRLVGSLMAWGRSQGAGHAWLQVLEANGPARALYRSLGFEPVYPYAYFTQARA